MVDFTSSKMKASKNGGGHSRKSTATTNQLKKDATALFEQSHYMKSLQDATNHDESKLLQIDADDTIKLLSTASAQTDKI